MEIFAVQYFYGASPAELDAIRPIHREWMGKFLESGELLASGPMLDYPQALLIFKSESIEALGKLLDNDPFEIAGFISSRTIQRWNPVFGPFSS